MFTMARIMYTNRKKVELEKILGADQIHVPIMYRKQKTVKLPIV